MSWIRITVVVAVVFCATGIPPAITPSSDFGVITENCGPEMTDEVRLAFLRYHNRERSRVAKGNYLIREKLSELSRLPPATRMYQLRYNCSLEKFALNWAQKAECEMIHSQVDGVGENLYIGAGNSDMYYANLSVSKWADEISVYGAENVSDDSEDISRATQMFWADTKTVGCGIILCDGNDAKMVVCSYYPGGNVDGMPWYVAGETLSECGKPKKNISDEPEKGNRPEWETPRWNTGLCEIST